MMKSPLVSRLAQTVIATSALIGFISQAEPSKPTLPLTQAPMEPPAAQKPTAGDHVQGSIKMAKVFFIEPKDGATVGKQVEMKFGNEGGLKVVPAGAITPGTGHYHVIIDGTATPEGTTIPFDAKDVHYGKGQTEAKIELAPGEHKLTLQFADGAHRSYGPILSQTITIHVK